MTNTRLVAYALIAIGIVALLSRLTADAGWLWIGLVAIGFLAAYQRERVYAFLVVGSTLMGVAVGILLEGSWHWPGTFLVSLGAGVAAIDLAAPRENRWPRVVGIALIVVGVITGLAEAGVLTSAAFAVLLIAAGIVLVVLPRRARPERGAAGAAGDASPVAAVGTPPTATPRTATPRTATPRTGTAPTGTAPTGTAAAGTAAAGTAAAPAVSSARLRRALLAWRQDTARAEGRREAMILRDDTVAAVAAARPTDLDELAEVRGVGPVTLERYGRAILDQLRRA
jgi:hypothetical protein